MRGPSALFAGWLGLAWELASIVIQLMCLLVARPGEIGLRHSSIGGAQRTVDIAFFVRCNNIRIRRVELLLHQ